MRTDTDIKSDILDELEWDPEVDTDGITVSVIDGAVILTGTVKSYPERQAAERAVKRVKGVVSIAEDLHVILTETSQFDDSSLAKRIAHVLEWDPALPHEKILAEVRDGAVTLTGEVEWHYQREVVEAHVARIAGIRSMTNLLTVKALNTKSEIEREIVRALHRNANIEASNIDIQVNDGVVSLGGKVKAAYEKKIVTDAVWKASGVIAVEDNIEVS